MSVLLKSVAVIAVVLAGAHVAGQYSVRSLRTQISIAAAPAAVWERLADTDKYGDWNPFIRSLDGKLEAGQDLSVTIRTSGDKTMGFGPRVLVSKPGRELRWRGKLLMPGIFDGEHYFILEEQADGSTLFRHGEIFSGMLVLPLFAMIREDTEAGFRAMNEALKARAELVNKS